MFNKTALLILALCSLTLAFDPRLQKAYFSVKPNSPFSYEFPQTGNGTYAHFFANSTSKYILFNITNGDAFTVLEDTASACQVATPIFQQIQYHVATDTLVYYCAGNSSLLFIDQHNQIVKSALSLDLGGIWPTAKLSTDGMSISILAMDSLFSANPKSSVLINVDMQTRQVASKISFDQNFTTGEAVVAYTSGTQGSYIATNRMDNNNVITKLYLIAIIGTTYKVTPLSDQVDMTSSKKTITKLFAMGNYIVANCDSTVYFLNNLGRMVRLDHTQTKELTPGIFHTALVRSTDGGSLYLHTDNFEVVKYTIVASGILTKSFGIKQDMLIAKANKASNDLMFTSDSNGVVFNIVDLQTSQYLRTTLFSYSDLMLTDSTYTVVQTLNKNTTSFSIFDLKTDNPVQQAVYPFTKYYYHKDQHIVTFLNAPETYFCQLTHIDLVSGKVWTTLKFTYAEDICSSFVLKARITEKGNPEVVLPLNQAYLIISETYGQVVFNTTYPTELFTDSINVHFDDLTFFYYTADKVLKNYNASFYTFNPQSKSFQLNSSKLITWKDVKSHGFFNIDTIHHHNYTVAISDLSFTIIKEDYANWFDVWFNDYNSVTGFEDIYGTAYFFFSYVGDDSQYPLRSAPMIYGNYGDTVWTPVQRKTTVSGTASGPRSFAFYDVIYSSVRVVRFFNPDPQSSKTISM